MIDCNFDKLYYGEIKDVYSKDIKSPERLRAPAAGQGVQLGICRMGREEPSRNEKTEDRGDISFRTRVITTSVAAWCSVGEHRSSVEDIWDLP